MRLPFVNYPYQNLNDLNLDYLLRVAREAMDTLKELGDVSGRVTELEAALEKLESGDVPEAMIETIINSIERDIIGLVGDMVKFVFFGLTDDGHFVAYIPEPWDEILFNTTEYDIKIDGVTEFGRLVLSY